jgi:NAD+ diphosphatase
MEPAGSTFVFCDSLLLVQAGGLEPAGTAALAELEKTRATLDDFVVRPQGCRAVGVAGAAEYPPAGCEWIRLRTLLGAESPHAATACRALGLLNWRAAHRFCGACGGALADHAVETARTCAACGRTEYPSLAPAVIVRVEKAGKILLAQHVQRIPDLWTCLAGYVELGESLEDCVRREVQEEVGIEVDAVRYVGSQHWPYPNQLMVGFTAQWKAGELKLQAEELSAARWFDPAEVPKIPPPGSMAYRLIRGG